MEIERRAGQDGSHASTRLTKVGRGDTREGGVTWKIGVDNGGAGKAHPFGIAAKRAGGSGCKAHVVNVPRGKRKIAKVLRDFATMF